MAGRSVPNETDETPKKGRFISSLEKTGNVSAACRAAGVGRATAYRWHKEDEEFAARWKEALETAIDDLEAVARRRAKKDSDTLLIFLLKAHRPEKYRESVKHEVGGTDGQPIFVKLIHGVSMDDL